MLDEWRGVWRRGAGGAWGYQTSSSGTSAETLEWSQLRRQPLGENNAIMNKKEKKTSERAAMKTKFTDVPLREKRSFEVVRLL